MPAAADTKAIPTLQTLPGDDLRQVMWRFADRYDLAMLVQSSRTVARGPVARLVAQGARNSHEWTPEKASLLAAFDESGITAAFLDPQYGGFIEGPKNLALALIAFELSWVDAGAATSSLAGNLGLAPIHERGTPEQRARYLASAAPPKPGENRQQIRAAFALTEPIPFVGVETGMLAGKVRIAEWKDGQEPLLQVEKRGRFITNMGFANVVTAAVDSDDKRLKGSCMIILEDTDPGSWDRGTPTKKLVHQLSSTRDPVLNVRVPANRIIGGYTVKDGVIIPRYSHGEIIEAVFRRTRVTVGLMTSAKLLSAIEPVVMYARRRFRGGQGAPGTPRYELGLQQKEDVLHRLVDVWATGEASASLGFAAARLFDALDPLERHKDEMLAAKQLTGRAAFKALGKFQQDALEMLQLAAKPAGARDEKRLEALKGEPLVQFALLDSQANVLCPACKLWNTGHGANMMREAVSLMGGYGVTEDCPGFLGQKWMDAQLEATYEGPEAVQRLQLSLTMTNELFLAQFQDWVAEMAQIASLRPGTGACTLATAMKLWLWTLNHLQAAADADGAKLYHKSRQSVTFPLADALCWLLAARQFILDLRELEEKGAANPALADGLPGFVNFLSDLCHVQSARAAGEAGRICAELVYGYNRHPGWDEASCGACYSAEELESLEGLIPGIDGSARAFADVTEANESHPPKAGPCVKLTGLEAFVRLRAKLDGCLTGARLAKDRAADALTKVMIPEALDYPA
ncbi:MAG TPA: acyl-CoA dehydrogenase family protein [Candidatus Paceibacterota bacterium]|nr:acyl-CoA dehydrogenase family protein [Verrucomicrobiota bacterium]HSA11258.1 acyl-CoA dehydrogenase family protein [Candidatus Paceibacterota bacterium]